MNHKAKSLLTILFALLISITALQPAALAYKCDRDCDCCRRDAEPSFTSEGQSNQCYIFVHDSTGTMPNGQCKAYTISDGDEIVLTLNLRRLMDPDHVTVMLPKGFEFIEITDSSMFTTSPVHEYDWQPDLNIESDGDQQELTLNLRDISSRIDQTILQFKCRVNQIATKDPAAIVINGKYISENPDYSSTFKSKYIYSLQMRVKTVDMSIEGDESLIDQYSGKYVGSGAYRLYYDKDLLKPVAFSQGDASYIYTAVQPDSDTVVSELNDDLGLLVLNGLHEGTYYLKQIRSPYGYNQINEPVEIKLYGEYKYDPNDPVNIEKEKEKEKDENLVNPLAHIFESFDKTEAEKQKDERMEELKKQRQLKLQAEYHATHPKQIIAQVSLANAPHYAREINSEINADVIIAYNASNSAFDVVFNLMIAGAIVGLGVTLSFMLNKKKQRNGR